MSINELEELKVQNYMEVLKNKAQPLTDRSDLMYASCLLYLEQISKLNQKLTSIDRKYIASPNRFIEIAKARLSVE